MNYTLQAMDLERYYQLLKKLAPGLQGLAFYEMNRQLVASYGSLLSKTHDELLGLIPKHTKTTHNEPALIKDRKKTLFAYQYLAVENGQCFALMIGVIDARDGLPEQADAVLHDAFSLITPYLLSDYQLTYELDVMARELGERYDELNLVYDTSDEASHFFESRDSLNEMVRNCSRYMNVTLAGLVMPDKHIELYHGFQLQQSISPNDTLEVIRQSLCPWVTTNKQPLVINNAPDDMDTGLCKSIDQKILAIPITLNDDQCCGTLFVLRNHDQQDFTNSDRNLLRVMARKAAKVVHASYDRLTGLVNRTSFDQLLHAAIHRQSQSPNQQCLLYIDVDQLHLINDIASITAGDALVQSIGGSILKTVRTTDIAGRIGSNAFAVILGCTTLTQGYKVAEKIRAEVQAQGFQWEDHSYQSSVSIGIVPITEDESVKNTLIMAEMACDSAKEQGRNRSLIYQRENQDYQHRRQQIHWVTRIQSALKENRFRLYAQPIVYTKQPAMISHYEILLRMEDEGGEILLPGQFMPTAEHYHLMPDIDRWVVENAFTTLDTHWETLKDTGVNWAINLSGQSLDNREFHDFVADILKNSRIPGSSIGFEITETAAISSFDKAQQFIRALKDQDAEISLDDFGTGLSSFDYLKHLPLDYIKIDGKFITDILKNPVSETMVQCISQVASVMNLKTIAEFVENEETLARLDQLGVTFAQGFALGKPIPIEQAFQILAVPLAEPANGKRAS